MFVPVRLVLFWYSSDTRGLLFCSFFHLHPTSLYIQYRVLWYLITKAILHKDSSLGDIHNRGMVQVIYKLVDNNKEGFTKQDIDQYSSYCSQFLQESVSKRQQLLVSSCLPIRCKAVHYCSNNPLMRKIFSLAQCSSTTADRLRIRNHFGKFSRHVLIFLFL